MTRSFLLSHSILALSDCLASVQTYCTWFHTAAGSARVSQTRKAADSFPFINLKLFCLFFIDKNLFVFKHVQTLLGFCGTSPEMIFGKFAFFCLHHFLIPIWNTLFSIRSEWNVNVLGSGILVILCYLSHYECVRGPLASLCVGFGSFSVTLRLLPAHKSIHVSQRVKEKEKKIETVHI